MSRRSDTPGLIRRQGGRALYWSAKSLARDIKNFPDPLIRLPADASPAAISDLCQRYAAELAAWLSAGPKDRWRYDGTVGGLCDVFETHPESPVHEVKRNTADSYRDSFKVIRATVGKRAVHAITAIDVKGWHRRWRQPAVEGGAERMKRAYDAVANLRMALRFGAALRFDNCKDLADELAMIQFERPARRESHMTLEHVRAFIKTSIARGDSRGLYMALGVAAQFETALRQKDVIGEWNGEEWSGAFTWENIPGGKFRLQTSKTGKQATFDLPLYDLLWPLIQAVPQTERVGAIVKGEGGLPIRERTYRKWFRQTATAAGIPNDVWNMDARAGAVTEALEAGADLTKVSRAATHSDVEMTKRYDRETDEAIVEVAAVRKKARRKV